MLKIEINRQNLLSILQLESRGANQYAELPILSSILIKTDQEKSTVKLTSTNLNQAILSEIPANIISSGTIAVPARITLDFLSSLTEETVTFEEGKNLKLKISTKNHRSTIYLLNPEEYPEIPQVSEHQKIELESNLFKDALSAVSLAASKDDSRPVLCGILLYTPTAEQLCLVATDGHRLAERTIPISPASKILENTIVPSSTIQDLLKIIQAQDPSKITILAEDDQISFSVGSVTLISRLVTGDYPEYKNLIPATSDINFSVDRAELLQTVKIAALFARESAGTVSLQVDQDSQLLSLNSIANQIGENHSQISISTDASGEINLNSRYLIDALNSFESELVDIHFSKGLVPFIISPAQSKSLEQASDHLHLIMPLNI
jgi:DNA polymerase-3 subunit beta